MTEGNPMTPTQTRGFIFVASILVLAGAALAAQFSPAPNLGFTSATALGIITASAVGIERALEAFWTFIGLTRGSWWPLGPLSTQINGLVNGLDTNLGPFFQEAEKVIAKTAEANNWTQDEIKA